LNVPYPASSKTCGTDILLYKQPIGKISVDGAAVHGEGGSINPQLVFPLDVQLDNQPDEAMLAIGRVRALLGTDQNVQSATAICPPVCEDLFGTHAGFRVASRPHDQVTSPPVELRFFLTPPQVEELERRRHAGSDDVFSFYLQLELTIIGLKNFNSYQSGATPSSIWDPKYGQYAELAVFWAPTHLSALPVGVATSTWVQSVLPGLGYDRLRLVEVTLPPPLPDRPNAAAEFDKAKAALDARRYEDSVSACRGLLAMWKGLFNATDDNRITDVIAERLGWTENDGRRKFLDALWKATMDFVNASHHPEGAGQTTRTDYRDARLAFLLTAVLSEYMGSIPP
jgi:hypothetical protein